MYLSSIKVSGPRPETNLRMLKVAMTSYKQFLMLEWLVSTRLQQKDVTAGMDHFKTMRKIFVGLQITALICHGLSKSQLNFSLIICTLLNLYTLSSMCSYSTWSAKSPQINCINSGKFPNVINSESIACDKMFKVCLIQPTAFTPIMPLNIHSSTTLFQ